MKDEKESFSISHTDDMTECQKRDVKGSLNNQKIRSS